MPVYIETATLGASPNARPRLPHGNSEKFTMRAVPVEHNVMRAQAYDPAVRHGTRHKGVAAGDARKSCREAV